jgi:hypothetical protein
MDNAGPPRVRADCLRAFCGQVFGKLGVPEGDAAIAADVLVAADLRGIESHGVARLPARPGCRPALPGPGLGQIVDAHPGLQR